MITLYNAISEDGFIAEKDGSEDFIPEEAWHDFLNLCKQYDVLVISRKTFEAIYKYPQEDIKEFEDLDITKAIITTDKNFSTKPIYKIIHSLEDISQLGKNILITSGPTLNTNILSIVDRIIFNVIPVKIGIGIKPFIKSPDLNLISSKKVGENTWNEYSVI